MVAGEFRAETADFRRVGGETAQGQRIGELGRRVIAGTHLLTLSEKRDSSVDAPEASAFLAGDMGEGPSVVGLELKRSGEGRVVVSIGGDDGDGTAAGEEYECSAEKEPRPGWPEEQQGKSNRTGDRRKVVEAIRAGVFTEAAEDAERWGESQQQKQEENEWTGEGRVF